MTLPWRCLVVSRNSWLSSGHNSAALRLGWHKGTSYCTELCYSANICLLKCLEVLILSKLISKGTGLPSVVGQVKLASGSWLTCVNFPEIGCRPKNLTGWVNLKSILVTSCFCMKVFFVNFDFYQDLYKCSFTYLLAGLQCALIGIYLICHLSSSSRHTSLCCEISTLNNYKILLK